MKRNGYINSLALAVVCLALPVIGNATTLSPADMADGSASGYTIESNVRASLSDPASTGFSPGGSLAPKTFEGATALGINESDPKPGDTPGEIDRDERLDISSGGDAFSVGSLSLTFLYDSPDFGDPNEEAVIRYLTAEGGSGLLRVERTASGADPSAVSVTDGSGSAVSNVLGVSAATESTPGEVQLGPIASGDALTEIQFTAGNQGGGPSSNNFSDFSVGSLDVASVPLPPTGSLLAIGLLIGAGARRRVG